jgi:hypothetical protein
MKKIAALVGILLALAMTGCEVPAEDSTPVQPAEKGAAGAGADKGEEKAAPPIKLTAKRIAYPAAEFATGGPYSCVKAVVTNQTKGNVEINPFYFAITGTDGEKRQAAVGAAKGEFDSLTLAPGEKASGTVCAETKVAAKTLTFTDGLNEAARAAVA